MVVTMATVTRTGTATTLWQSPRKPQAPASGDCTIHGYEDAENTRLYSCSLCCVASRWDGVFARKTRQAHKPPRSLGPAGRLAAHGCAALLLHGRVLTSNIRHCSEWFET